MTKTTLKGILLLIIAGIAVASALHDLRAYLVDEQGKKLFGAIFSIVSGMIIVVPLGISYFREKNNEKSDLR